MKHTFKETAALIAEPARAIILWTLLDGKAYTATELAIAAETSSSNISMHLTKLLSAGLLKVATQGRHRYYAYAGKEVAYAVEALAALMPFAAKRSPEKVEVPALRQARTCYDHLAGKAGVAIMEAMVNQKIITTSKNDFTLSAKGKQWFLAFDIDTDILRQQRRSFVRPCLDWSERKHHLAGSVAAALLDKMLLDDWLRKSKDSRALIITAKGEKMLYEKLRVII